MITDKRRFWLGIGLLGLVLAGSAELVVAGSTGYWWPVMGPTSVTFNGRAYDDCAITETGPKDNGDVYRTRLANGEVVFAVPDDPRPNTITVQSGAWYFLCVGHDI